jgi:hypothetical protein
MRGFFPVFLNEWKEFLTGKYLRLFANDYYPHEDDLDEAPVEAEFSGYRWYPLEAWRHGYINEDGEGQLDHDNVVFSYATPGQNSMVYGYYVTDLDDQVIFAERNPDGPVYMSTPSQTYPVQPGLTLRNDPGDPVVPLRKKRRK